MYDRKHFGEELKNKIINKEEIHDIGHWIYSVYLEHIDDIDLEFRDMLLTLNMMEDGPEFAYSHEELMQIANSLISGKQVTL